MMMQHDGRLQYIK